MANKFSKKKIDVSYIDPKTGKVLCTFNQCRDKFTVEGHEIMKDEYDEEKHIFYHACVDCGRKEQTRTDKFKSQDMTQKALLEKITGKKNVTY